MEHYVVKTGEREMFKSFPYRELWPSTFIIGNVKPQYLKAINYSKGTF